jgi:hypothetical protein
VVPAERGFLHNRIKAHLFKRRPVVGVIEAQLAVGIAPRGPQRPVALYRGRVLPPKGDGLHARKAHLSERPPVGRVTEAQLPVGVRPRGPQRPVAEKRSRVLAACDHSLAAERHGLHVGQVCHLGELGPVGCVVQSQLPVGIQSGNPQRPVALERG